jgi:hypothetical protein
MGKQLASNNNNRKNLIRNNPPPPFRQNIKLNNPQVKSPNDLFGNNSNNTNNDLNKPSLFD